jgi:nucleotide-binding universal stress UspA family protein
MLDMPRLRTINVVHATALTPEDEIPHQHAAAIVAAAGGQLYSVHVTDVLDSTPEIPEVSDLLHAWAGARGTSVEPMEPMHSLEHRRLVTRGAEELDVLLLRTIDELRPDLVVAGTHSRRGVGLALMGSTAQALAREAQVPVLLLPVGHTGFVDPGTGALRLRKILVPMGDPHEAQTAIDGAVRLAELTGEHVGDFVLVHVGDEAEAPAVTLHGGLGWGRRWVRANGGVVDEVLDLAEAEHADLVVMASRGRDSVVDSVLGSRTERVLRRSPPCPVLVVPVSAG